MKLPKVPLVGFLGFASFFLIPIAFATAQSQGLVPCGGASGAENYLQATACNLCDLGKLIQGLINFLIGLAIPIAALLVAWAGVLYFTAGGDFSKHAKALSIFKHVILGFVLALTSWLIVQTLLYALFKNSYYQGWNNIQCSSESRPRSAAIGSLLAPLTGLNANPGTSVRGCAASHPNLSEAGQCCNNDYTQCVSPSVLSGGGSGTGAQSGNLVEINAFSCKNSQSCSVSTETNLKLAQMRANLEAQGLNPAQFQITEAGVNTTVSHASGANNLDMSCFGICNESQVKAAVSSWGGTAVYETNSSADYNAKLNAGVPSSNMLLLTGTFDSAGNCTAGPGKCITAPHLSLKP